MTAVSSQLIYIFVDVAEHSFLTRPFLPAPHDCWDLLPPVEKETRLRKEIVIETLLRLLSAASSGNS